MKIFVKCYENISIALSYLFYYFLFTGYFISRQIVENNMFHAVVVAFFLFLVHDNNSLQWPTWRRVCTKLLILAFSRKLIFAFCERKHDKSDNFTFREKKCYSYFHEIVFYTSLAWRCCNK